MATAEGTGRVLRRAVQRGALHPANVRPLGPHLSCAAVGFGAYRIGGGPKDHEVALRAAFRAGVNLVDTSSHYSAVATGGHGTSESLIGKVIAEAMEAGEVARDEIILCTKLGHGPPGTPPPSGSVGIGARGETDSWHCIEPAFVDQEVRASQARLGTAPDFVFLHNPEYFLSSQLQKRVPITDAWDEMYKQLEASFRVLEALCDEGVIADGYGVSANFLSCQFSTTGNSNVYEALMLDRVIDAAGAAAVAAGRSRTDHRFRVAQLPLNAIEGGAVLGRGNVVPEAAEGDCYLAGKLGVSVLANRPLMALPMPGVSSGDWGRNQESHVRLRDEVPMKAVEALLRRTLREAMFEGSESTTQNSPLQQLALRLSLSAPSVSAALCGARTEAYLQDVVAVLREPPLTEDQVTRGLSMVRSAAEELGCQHRGLW